MYHTPIQYNGNTKDFRALCNRKKNTRVLLSALGTLALSLCALGVLYLCAVVLLLA